MRRAIFPVLILTAGLAAVWLVPMKRPASEAETPPAAAPTVSVVEAQPEDIALSVTAYGTVTPRTEIDLVAEISGKVIHVAPAFVAGGFFAKGELLVAVDPRDYELAVTRAEAQVAEARQSLEREQAEADLAAEEWQAMGGGETAHPLVLRKPQMAEVTAKLKSAEADLAQARLELQRTSVRAPFGGRVRSKTADLGTYVTPGEQLARIYATDVAEIRLPLDDRQLQFLDAPLGRQKERRSSEQPDVEISAMFAGKHRRWFGKIVRTEGTIDPQSRLLYVVAEITDPYMADRANGKPPLAPGMFVTATIRGATFKQVYPVPRIAMRNPAELLIVDDDDVLRVRPVDVLKEEPDRVIVSRGLHRLDRVVVKHPANIFAGTKVRVTPDTDSPAIAKATGR